MFFFISQTQSEQMSALITRTLLHKLPHLIEFGQCIQEFINIMIDVS